MRRALFVLVTIGLGACGAKQAEVEDLQHRLDALAEQQRDQQDLVVEMYDKLAKRVEKCEDSIATKSAVAELRERVLKLEQATTPPPKLDAPDPPAR